tara:strand:- start:56 stop:283 length:228 start_codon:yes stop_codon:yes gene_type:complete
MNEQFENLMYQAGLTAQGCWDEMDDYDHAAIEKFAKLIVRECASAVFQMWFDDELSGCDMAAAHTKIIKHFGVEE